MSESSASLQRKTDWSGTIIGALIAPVFFLFVYLGKPKLAFAVSIVLAMTILAVKLRWPLRKYTWFWATIVSVLAIQAPLLLIVHWSTISVPMRAIAFPVGGAEFFVISGAISLAKMIFLKGDAPNERGQQQ